MSHSDLEYCSYDTSYSCHCIACTNIQIDLIVRENTLLLFFSGHKNNSNKNSLNFSSFGLLLCFIN